MLGAVNRHNTIQQRPMTKQKKLMPSSPSKPLANKTSQVEVQEPATSAWHGFAMLSQSGVLSLTREPSGVK
eukprot:1642950-Amphidinium_carterae.1